MVQESILDILKALKEILVEEKEALIKNEGNAIQEIVSKKEAIIEELKNAEIENSNKEETRQLVGEIQELQETNAMLTQQAMNYTSVFLSAFQKEAQKNTTYSKEGSYEKTKNSSILDQSL